MKEYFPAGPFGSPNVMVVTSPDESYATGGSSEKEKKRHQSSSRTIGEESVSSPVDSPSIPDLQVKNTLATSLQQASSGGVSSDGGLAADGGLGSGAVSEIEDKME